MPARVVSTAPTIPANLFSRSLELSLTRWSLSSHQHGGFGKV